MRIKRRGIGEVVGAAIALGVTVVAMVFASVYFVATATPTVNFILTQYKEGQLKSGELLSVIAHYEQSNGVGATVTIYNYGFYPVTPNLIFVSCSSCGSASAPISQSVPAWTGTCKDPTQDGWCMWDLNTSHNAVTSIQPGEIVNLIIQTQSSGQTDQNIHAVINPSNSLGYELFVYSTASLAYVYEL